jgi:hypothetical protein
MSKYPQPLSNYLLLFIIKCMVAMLSLFTQIGYGQIYAEESNPCILQGSLHIKPVKNVPGDQTDKIQPGTQVKIDMTVENKGGQVSPAGQIYVRYAFSQPLEHEKSSILFETEKKSLPPIEPGKKIEFAFDTPHQIPSVLDFVRYDWSLREYQTIALIHQQEYIIGTLAVTFSAYYYPGVKKEFPTKICNNEKN